MAETKPLSFGFSKKIEKKDITKSVVAENEKAEDTTIDYVTSVDNKTIKGYVLTETREINCMHRSFQIIL